MTGNNTCLYVVPTVWVNTQQFHNCTSIRVRVVLELQGSAPYRVLFLYFGVGRRLWSARLRVIGATMRAYSKFRVLRHSYQV